MANYLVLVCLLLVNVLDAVPRRHIDFKLNWKVVGGSNAKDGAHPYQISLQDSGSHRCGGSIVNNEWVITAAHCVDRDEPPYSLHVVAGITKLSTGGTSYAVLEIYYHENFIPWTLENDVAILKVEPITYTEVVSPIILETEYVGEDVNVTLSGWGSTILGGSISNDLQEIDLTTTTVEYCQSRHSDPVTDSEICTLTKVGEGACHGDSGGPLTRTVNEVKKLVGIVSWGKPCAVGYPDVFARVSFFHAWFQEKCNCL